MTSNINYDMLALSFDTNCLRNVHFNTLELYEFYHAGGISKGYLNVTALPGFILDMEDTSIFNECLLNMDYDFILDIEQLHNCNTEITNQIMYDNNSKPAAWQLDYLNVVKDNKYNYIAHSLEDNNIDIWILDTGINWRHKEFDFGQVTDEDPLYTILNITHPHGTGTASAAAGINYGSAKHFHIYNYPVCRVGGGCANSDIEHGFLKVLDHVKNKKLVGGRSVINLSVGISLNYNPMNTSLGQFYNGLFKDITENGGIVVVAAGNSNQDACNWLYSFSPFVISVGSIDQNYNKSGFSNWGDCIDIWAFGSNVPVAYHINDTTVVQHKSGTSFSAPLVTGLIANILYDQPSLSKDQILNILYQKVNGFVNPKYDCGHEDLHCCQSAVPGTRLDAYCRRSDIYHCDRTCMIGKC